MTVFRALPARPRGGTPASPAPLPLAAPGSFRLSAGCLASSVALLGICEGGGGLQCGVSWGLCQSPPSRERPLCPYPCCPVERVLIIVCPDWDSPERAGSPSMLAGTVCVTGAVQGPPSVPLRLWVGELPSRDACLSLRLLTATLGPQSVSPVPWVSLGRHPGLQLSAGWAHASNTGCHQGTRPLLGQTRSMGETAVPAGGPPGSPRGLPKIWWVWGDQQAPRDP